jgi:hypothetical protein
MAATPERSVGRKNAPGDRRQRNSPHNDISFAGSDAAAVFSFMAL